MTAALLERLILEAWPARERATLQGWTMMADGGVTGRVNAVAPLAFRGADAEAAIDDALAWLAARGLPPRFKVADGAAAPADIAERLARRGWRADTETLVMTAALADARTRLGPPAHPVTLDAEMTDAMDRVVRESASSAAEYAERVAIARRTPQPRRFAGIVADGMVAAVGLGVVTDDWASIFLMRTHPAHRRRGLARSVLGALVDWAECEGPMQAFLQVEADNAPAIALYRDAGFVTAYRYRYWRPAV
jgi:ribosomal protein S18 acetylase RimI-like enzyme